MLFSNRTRSIFNLILISPLQGEEAIVKNTPSLGELGKTVVPDVLTTDTYTIDEDHDGELEEEQEMARQLTATSRPLSADFGDINSDKALSQVWSTKAYRYMIIHYLMEEFQLRPPIRHEMR